MIYIVVALYPEAKPIIKHYKLKQENNTGKFRIFKNNEIIVVITGTGSINAAIGTTHILTLNPPASNDILLNFGICGDVYKKFNIGEVILCNKIIDSSSGKDFYPDIIYKHPFNEATIETVCLAVDKKQKSMLKGGQIVDMEASGVFRAATKFLPLQNIYFVKIVSDYLDFSKVTPLIINNIIEKSINNIDVWINSIRKETQRETHEFSEENKKLLESITNHLKLSVTMRHQLFEYAKLYYIRTGKNIEFINKYLNIECRTKNEGKKYFEEIKKRFDAG